MPQTEIIDLRSDTVTLPTEEMLEAIRHAELGDDVFGEDSTVNRLEKITAEKMGKEAALLVTSGTQANLVSLMSNTNPGELVILEAQSHIYWYEVGGICSIAGLMPCLVKSRLGSFDPEVLEAAIRPKDIHYPPLSLICAENTHNRHGGTVITPERLRTTNEVAKKHGLRLYMDGARLFNAAVALGASVQDFTKHVDNLMFCLSKSLSCPIGSLVVGTHEFVQKARKMRKILGGGMRQAGIVAAPGIIALEKMVDRLKEDHRNAKRLAKGIANIDGIKVDLNRVQTNIIVFDISDLTANDALFLSKLKEQDILALNIAKNKVRMVTHRGVEKNHVEKAINAIENISDELGCQSI